MKCTKCGYEFEEGLFCPECGTKYDKDEAKRIEIEEEEAAKKRSAEEKLRQETLKQETEEKKIEEELRRREEKEKRDLEIEKTKVEQARLEAEKIAHEAELIRQQNEKARIEQENKIRMEEQEKKRQEELTRTFNGVLYNSIHEMNLAKAKYEEQIELVKKTKNANLMAIWSFVLSIATYPLVMLLVLWFPSLITSIVLAVIALKAKTNKKGFVIASFIINGFFILICVLSVILALIVE